MSSSAKLNGREPENFPLLQNPGSESQFTTKLNNFPNSNQPENPPPYAAIMSESTHNAVAGTTAQNSEEQAPLVPIRTMTTEFQDVLVERSRLQGEVATLRVENATLRVKNAALQGEKATLQGKLNGEEGGQKRLLILFLFILVFIIFVLFAGTLASRSGNSKTTD